MRSGVGAAWARVLERLRDFADVFFFFVEPVAEALLEELDEEDCAATELPAAADTTRAALAKSAALKMNSEACFLIARVYCSGAGTEPAR